MTFTGKDALRYLRITGEPDERTLAALARAETEVRAAADPRFAERLLPVRSVPATEPDGAPTISFGDAFSVQSRSLAQALRGCGRAFLFVATLGPGVDRLLRRAQATSLEEAACIQAVAAELTDAWCDDVCARLAADPAVAGYPLRPRFSPGYGDVPLSIQPAFFAAVDATRRIGVSLTESHLMVPVKSVSAFVGVRDDEEPRAAARR